MFHLLAFNGSLALNAANAQIAAVIDSAVPKSASGDFIMPFNGKILAHHVIGITTFKAQVQAPSMRTIAFPELHPVNITVRTAIPDMNRVQQYGDMGPRFMANESLGVYASENGTGVSLTSAGLWIAEQQKPAPSGQTIPLVATCTIVTVDGAWILGTLAFDTQLAAGEYSVVGLTVEADNSIYARLVFPGVTSMRPGVPVLDINTDAPWKDLFRLGRFGEFGTFVFNAPPQLELFGAAAASTPVRVIMDVVKIR